jgi:pilus assembly protein CpaF
LADTLIDEIDGLVRLNLAQSNRVASLSNISAIIREHSPWLTPTEVISAAISSTANLTEFGPLTPLVADQRSTDILVKSKDEIWIDLGNGLELTQVCFTSEAEVRGLAQRLATNTGRRLDEAHPYVDVPVADGIRMHAIIPPIARGSTQIAFRLIRNKQCSLADLVGDEISDFLIDLLSQRRSILISGGTGAGKTTLLTALLGEVSPSERILIIEDTSEVFPKHPHVVHLQSRETNVEGAGAVTMRDLVRQALRMRPDRLVIGEVRGAEIVDLLAALNSGHDGAFATIHANSAAAIPARIEALGVAAGLDRLAVHSQLASAIEIIVHLRRENSRRFVSEISEIQVKDDGLCLVKTLGRWL